ncbi:MAG: hypothetical protein AAF598_07200 [Bacteroidota bacterium]
MKPLILCIMLVYSGLLLQAQADREKIYESLDNLIEGYWESEPQALGKGNTFHQRLEFNWDLNGQILEVITKRPVKVTEDSVHWEVRNKGIRAWNPNLEQVRFWEFDIEGGLTEGMVQIDGKSIYYDYQYKVNNDEFAFRDSWIWVDENTYRFEINIYQEGDWKNLLSTMVRRVF